MLYPSTLIWNCRILMSFALTYVSTLFSPRLRVAARLLAAESQLAVLKHRIDQEIEPKPRFSPAFRLLWMLLCRFWPDWRDAAHLMKPATVVKWHRQGFRLFWRWKTSKRGRPNIDKDMRQLIRQLSNENELWSAERIHDHLVLLGFNPPHPDTIRKYMVKPSRPRKPSQTWLTFLRNHLHESWAIDFCTVPTATFSVLYVFVVLEHGRRRVCHFNVTRFPTMGWIIQQLREAMPDGRQPRFMFRDNDRVYGNGVTSFLEACGVEEIRTAYRSPWQNPFVERFFGTLRRELLNHIIPFNDRHLYRLVEEFVEKYYHSERPHQGLGGDTPVPHQPHAPPIHSNKLISIPILGGLHHRYKRLAA
jgi:transposase InsO family protein